MRVTFTQPDGTRDTVIFDHENDVQVWWSIWQLRLFHQRQIERAA